MSLSIGSTRGSSPRVRGTRAAELGAPQPNRFIPACAGNAFRVRERSPAPPVHPRVCGERLVRSRPPAPVLRFIPACAGNAVGAGYLGRVPAVHPRVCGERGGSGGYGRNALRFIPACAGNAPVRSKRSSISSVHPRVCGERGGEVCRPGRLNGSSPRVRGTRF